MICVEPDAASLHADRWLIVARLHGRGFFYRFNCLKTRSGR